MGNWFSRSGTSTKERLEHIQDEIERIEHSKWLMMRSQKHMIGFFLFVSILLYILFTGTFYIYYFEEATSYGKVKFCLCLLLVPIFIYYSKQLLLSYYASITDRNEERLLLLRKEKRTILDKVMETETYKVAKELLEKYDPSVLTKDKHAQQQREWKMANQTLLVHRNPTASAPAMANIANTPRIAFNASNPSSPATISSMGTPMRQVQGSQLSAAPRLAGPSNTPIRAIPFPVTPTPHQRPAQMPVSSLTRPIPPQDRSIVEKMVDYVIGDGPNNRYALICHHCASHNGMALKEEFEYLAFRCCYCLGFNPARKQKPVAPRLTQHFQLANQPHNTTGTSSLNETKSIADDNPQVDEPESESEDNKLKIEDITESDKPHVASQPDRPTPDTLEATNIDTKANESVLDSVPACSQPSVDTLIGSDVILNQGHDLEFIDNVDQESEEERAKPTLHDH